jgi:hypothetical protein
LSQINDLFERLLGAKHFSGIDLKLKYYQIRIAEVEVEKIMCCITYRSWKFIVMPFGLCNATSTFTTLMNIVFQEKMDDFVIIYIDDILVYSKKIYMD